MRPSCWLEGGVDDHVLLAADVARLGGALQDLTGRDVIALGDAKTRHIAERLWVGRNFRQRHMRAAAIRFRQYRSSGRSAAPSGLVLAFGPEISI